MSPRHLLPLFTLSAYLVSSEILLESGYSITTVLDFNKPLPSGGLDVSGIHPFALHPLTRSANLLILLDSINSTFYSLDLPLSQESRVRLLSGKRTAGFSDGDAIYAMFNRPRSFALDSNDNVYVADRINHVIRKISGFSDAEPPLLGAPEMGLLNFLPENNILMLKKMISHYFLGIPLTRKLNNTFSYLILGVTTTIAGGYSRKAGHTDGPAQNATFSDDFDLLFMHKMCSLLISDRGSGMIRQMDLKPEDCEEKPQSSKGLGAISVSVIAVLAMFCGLALGFIARPFVTSNSSAGILREPLHPPLMESYSNNSEESSTDVQLRHQKHFVSSNQKLKLQESADDKKDLIDFEEESSVLDLSFSTNEHVGTEEASGRNLHETEDEGSLNAKIDDMMVTNLLDFTTQIKQRSLVKRRLNGAHDLSLQH